MSHKAKINDNDVPNVLSLLERWIAQRAGLDPANYGCHPEQLKYTDREGRREARRSMANEQRSIATDGKRARLALQLARAYPPNAAALMEAFERAFSGRLSLARAGADGLKLDYCTGQYFPTEYRAAAAAVLEQYIDTVRPKHTPGGRIPCSIGELEDMNHAAGGKWFDASNKRFFRSRVVPEIVSGPGGVYFVSSEQREDHTPRLFTVRHFDPETADIDTFGEFQGFGTKAQALREARRAACAPAPLCRMCAGSGKKADTFTHQQTEEDCWRCKGSGLAPKEEAA